MLSYLVVVVRYRRSIAAFAIGIAMLATVVRLLLPRQYVAGASFNAQDEQETLNLFTQFAGGLAGLVPDLGRTPLRFYAHLLNSWGVSRAVVLTEYRIDGSNVFAGDLVEYFEVRSNDRERAILKAIKKLRRRSSIGTNDQAGLVEFSVEFPERELAVQVAERFLDLVNTYNLEGRQSRGRAEREFVEQRLAEAAAGLAAAESSLVGFLGTNREFARSPRLLAERDRINRQIAQRQQLYTLLSQNFEQARIDEVRDTPVITIIDPPESVIRPKSRRTVMIAFAALTAGLLIGVVLAFVREYLASMRARNSEDYRALQDEFRGMARRIVGRRLDK